MSHTYTAGLASIIDSFADPPPPPPGPDDPPPPLLFYFLLVTYDGTPTYKLTQINPALKSKSGKNKLEFQQRPIVQPTTNGPTSTAILQARPLPGSKIRVEVTFKSKPPQIEEFDFSPALNQGQVTLGLRHDAPPRLALAINTSYVAKSTSTSNFKQPDGAAIKEILAHIHGRLTEGLDAAWLGSDAAPEIFYAGSSPTSEQRWARAITELTLVAPYGLPSTMYSEPSTKSVHVFSDEEVMGRYFDPVDPAYPLTFECQHLVTLAAMTRGQITGSPKPGADGFTHYTLSTQFTAGGPSLGVATTLRGRNAGTELIAPLFGTKDNPEVVAPGSSWVYDGPDGPNSGSAHIGFAVRVDANRKRIQTLDTGGLNVRGRQPPLIQPEGTFDDPWCASSMPGPAPQKGVPPAVFKGVCLMPEAGEAALKAEVERMAKLRPIGFARLVLIKRGPTATTPRANILFSTPLLRMHFGAKNFPFAQYLWSLREHPGGADITAIWMFYTMRGAIARGALFGDPAAPTAGARSLTVQKLISLAGITTPAKDALGVAFHIEDQESLEDGSVWVSRRYDQHIGGHKGKAHAAMFDALPWGLRDGTVRLTDAELADLPYFTSG